MDWRLGGSFPLGLQKNRRVKHSNHKSKPPIKGSMILNGPNEESCRFNLWLLTRPLLTFNWPFVSDCDAHDGCSNQGSTFGPACSEVQKKASPFRASREPRTKCPASPRGLRAQAPLVSLHKLTIDYLPAILPVARVHKLRDPKCFVTHGFLSDATHKIVLWRKRSEPI